MAAPPPIDPTAMAARYRTALEQRQPWENIWRECRQAVLPSPHGHAAATVFDGTAADAAEQLAASLVAELTPPWSRWFALGPTGAANNPALATAMEQAAETLQRHLDRSSFIVELHQAYLDLVVAGTGIVLVEEAPLGGPSALRFRAIPLQETVLQEGPDGRLDTIWRRSTPSPGVLRQRFPQAATLAPTADERHALLEAVWPETTHPRGGYRYAALLLDSPETPTLLAEGHFVESPFIAFRWMKAPGESYGRSPVMKALPDIRTANKVVELVLQNASIACTGIWLADDDGVLNPATIQLVPGAIIPKAPGSSGLTPLAAAGDFDVSQLVLTDLRARIRAALLADRLSPPSEAPMTATAVLERSATTARLLGATYGRLQSELLAPMLARCLSILRRRGEIAPALLDRQEVALRYVSPLAQVQGRADAGNTLAFLDAARSLGGTALAEVNMPAATRWLARCLGVPPDLMQPSTPETAPSPTSEEPLAHE